MPSFLFMSRVLALQKGLRFLYHLTPAPFHELPDDLLDALQFWINGGGFTFDVSGMDYQAFLQVYMDMKLNEHKKG